MIVKCPQCSTGYNIPEAMIGDKPRKMRCSRCQHVFAITRRQPEAPSGYEEFTGEQSLPNEFAFLREAPAAPPPSAEPPSPATEEPAPPATEDAPPKPQTPEGLYRAVVEGPDVPTETIPLEPKLVSGPTPPAPSTPAPPPTTPTPAAPTPAVPDAATDSASATPPPTPAPAALVVPDRGPRQSGSSSVPEIYSTTSAWEMEAPLELDGYALAADTPSSGQFAGKLMTAIFILVVAFVVFVAYRNGWSLSIPDLGEQIAFAFSGEELEELPEETREISATVRERTAIIADDKTTYLKVMGEVFNNSNAPRAQIIMRGRLIDSAGDIRDEMRAPCGKVVDEDTIKITAKGAMAGHFRPGGQLYNCSIKADSSTVFQLIFENVPADYDASFEIEVQAVSATYPD